MPTADLVNKIYHIPLNSNRPMAERIHRRQVKDSTYTNTFMRVIAKWCSGGDPEIIDRLPSSDIFQYGVLGYINVFIGIFFGYGVSSISRIIYGNTGVTNVLIFFVFFVISFLLFRQLGKRLINTGSSASKTFFIIYTLILAVPAAYGFMLIKTNSARKDREKEIEKSYQTLQSYRSTIDSLFQEGKKSFSYYNYGSMIKNISAYNDSFVTFADSKKIELELPADTILIERLNDFAVKYNRYDRDSFLRPSDTLEIYAKSSLSLIDSILPGFKNNMVYNELSASQKIDIQRSFINNGILLASAPYALSILLVLPSLLTIIGRFNKNDFYHTLLIEKERLKEETLKKERKKATEELRIEAELKNTKTGLESIEQVDDESQKIKNELNQNLSVYNLEKAAQVEYRHGSYERALDFINKAIELQDEITNRNPNEELRPELYQVKARILAELQDPERAKQMLDRFVELNNEKKYRSNLKKEILLDRLDLKSLPFFGDLKWNFTDKVNILLGKNGYGKSHVLGLIIAMLYDDNVKRREWIPDTAISDAKAKLYLKSDHAINTILVDDLISKLNSYQKELADDADNKKLSQTEINNLTAQINSTLERIDTEQRRILASKEGISGAIGRVPILAIPDSRFIDKSEQGITNDTSISDDLKRDGATEFLYARSFARIIKKGLHVTAQQNSTNFEKDPYLLIERVISELAGTKNDSAFFTFERVEIITTTGDYKFLVRSEDNNELFPLQQVSQGTFSVLAIFLMIYRFLSELKPGSKDVFKEKAIVFIDEIDAHLHPSWEQKIISILRKEFPNVQFIITAHSPLIVAGCFEGEVAVMRHEKSKGFTIEQPKGDFIGYTTGEMFRKVFEVEDKDSSYLDYADMISDEQKYEIELEDYKTKKKNGITLLPKEEERMNILYETLNRINSAKNMREKRVESSVLKSKNKELQSRVEYLERQINDVNKKLKENTN